jgi:fatty-acyl-CoA synthase
VAQAPGQAINLAALADFMAERVAEPPARPKSIELVDEIPLTPVGKIFKPRLREIAAEHAVRQMLATKGGSEGLAVRAATDPERGLVVRVEGCRDAADRTAIRQLLGQLPLTVDVVETIQAA